MPKVQKFRKRPVVVEAEQFFAHKKPWPRGVKVCQLGGVDEDDVGYTYRAVGIETLEGLMEVSDGDWIITGVKGEKYPCKPDIFEATYEAV